MASIFYSRTRKEYSAMQTFNYVSLHVSSCFLVIGFQCTGLFEIADGPVINYLETSSETAEL